LVLEPQIKLASVVGTYSRNDNSGSMQLNSDGSVFVQTQGNSAGVSGTWKLVNGNMVQVSFTLLGTPVTYQYNLVGNQLVSTSDSTNVLTKQGSASNSAENTPLPTQTSTQLPWQTKADSADSQGWLSYGHMLEPGSVYIITITANEGYSFDSYSYITSTHTTSTIINDAQSSLTVSGDEMTINAYTAVQNGKGSTASITLIPTSSIHLDLEVRYGTATITVK
jgi:hypothetical protein